MAVATIAAVLVLTTTGVAAAVNGSDNNSSNATSNATGNATYNNNTTSNTTSNNTTSGPPITVVTPAPPPSPASTEVVAYRVHLWAYVASWVVANYRAPFAVALAADLTKALGASSVALNDVVLVAGTSDNITAVVTVRGASSEAAFIASLNGNGPAAWATAVNSLLSIVWFSLADRGAVAAVASSYYTSVYLTAIERLPSADLPKTRYYQIVLEGKHLGAAAARADWNAAVSADLATAFGISAYMATHLNLTSQEVGGTNRTALTVRFLVKPVVAVAVDAVTFFATRGAAAWLTQVAAVHKHAAYAALNVSTPAPAVMSERGAAALADGGVPESELSVTVTSTGYAPGDESYTPGDAAGGAATTLGLMTVILSAVVMSMVAL
jgi:hypothetical protein